MKSSSREYALSPETIDEISEDLRAWLEEARVERRMVLRFRLSTEEILLFLQEHGVTSLRVEKRRRLGRVSFLLRYGGEALDPIQGSDEWSGRILENLGLAPVWNYRGGTNTVQLRPPKTGGIGTLAQIFIAAALAAAMGLAGNLLSPELRQAVTNILLTPVFNAFLGLLTTLAGPLIFLTVSSGVFGIGDTASLHRIGKVLFSRIFAIAFLSAVISLLVTRPFFRLVPALSGGGGSQLLEISEMVFNILPSNVVRPFLDGNTLQVITLAIFMGIVLLILGEQSRRVCRLIEDTATVVQMMMEAVCSLIPVFVFTSLLRQIWSGRAGDLLGLWKPFCLIVATAALLALIHTLIVSAQVRVSPLLLLKKAFPPFFLAFTTESSMAAYPLTVATLEQKMGVRKNLIDFSYPLGAVMLMPGAVVNFVVISGYLSETYGTEVSPSWYVMVVLMSTILSVAAPPVPGAMLTCYGIVLAQLNIPMEGMLQVAALDVFTDFFMTGTDVLMLEMEMVAQGDILHMIDKDVLRAE